MSDDRAAKLKQDVLRYFQTHHTDPVFGPDESIKGETSEDVARRSRDREALSHALRARSPDALREELVRVTEERDALRSVTRRRSEEVERLRRELGMRRERFTPAEAAERMLMVKDIVEEQHRTLRDELRALRRELARWEAVARWLGADCDRALGGFCDGFEVIEWLDVREYRTEARAPTIPALAAALGLEVEP